MMNVTQLRAFVAVVEHGSFSEAARVMGLSQPAVTMQIQGLESDLGVTLLERHYRRIEMTEAGRALLPYARVVLGEMEAARAYIETRLGDRFLVLDSSAALQAGLFGSGTMAPETPYRIGDLVVIPREDYTLVDHEKSRLLLGRHGGLTDAEMLVPLIASRLDA